MCANERQSGERALAIIGIVVSERRRRRGVGENEERRRGIVGRDLFSAFVSNQLPWDCAGRYRRNERIVRAVGAHKVVDFSSATCAPVYVHTRTRTPYIHGVSATSGENVCAVVDILRLEESPSLAFPLPIYIPIRTRTLVSPRA